MQKLTGVMVHCGSKKPHEPHVFGELRMSTGAANVVCHGVCRLNTEYTTRDPDTGLATLHWELSSPIDDDIRDLRRAITDVLYWYGCVNTAEQQKRTLQCRLRRSLKMPRFVLKDAAKARRLLESEIRKLEAKQGEQYES